MIEQINCVHCKERFDIRTDSSNGANGRVRPNGANGNIPGDPRGAPPVFSSNGHGANGELNACPRCDADNERWYEVLNFSRPSGDQSPTNAQRLLTWIKRFGIELILIFLVAIAPVGFGAFGIHGLHGPGTAVTFIMVSIITALFLIYYMAQKWSDFRDQLHWQEFNRSHAWRNWLSRPVLIGFVFVLGFSVLAPAGFYIFLPAGINAIRAQFEQMTAPTSAEQRLAELEKAMRNLEKAVGPGDNPEFLDVEQKMNDLLPQVAGIVMRYPAEPPPAPPLKLNPSIFTIWTPIVGIVGITALILGYFGALRFAKSVDDDLPRPIYRNLPTMRKVATVEAQEALNLEDEELQQFRWVDIKQDRHGGMKLQGLLRQGNRTKRYVVETDRWARVISVEVR